MSISSYSSDHSAASQPLSQDFTQSTPSRQSGMVQPVIQEMFATVHAAGSSLLGFFSSCIQPSIRQRDGCVRVSGVAVTSRGSFFSRGCRGAGRIAAVRERVWTTVEIWRVRARWYTECTVRRANVRLRSPRPRESAKKPTRSSVAASFPIGAPRVSDQAIGRVLSIKLCAAAWPSSTHTARAQSTGHHNAACHVADVACDVARR
eukprot:scaffold5475_cov127-Isochrysis_galbana.AAC.3